MSELFPHSKLINMHSRNFKVNKINSCLCSKHKIFYQ